MMKKILFICSPSIALMDTVIPVLDDIKDNYEINILIPKSGKGLFDYNKDNNLIKIAKKITRNIYVQKNYSQCYKYTFNDFLFLTKQNSILNLITSKICKLLKMESNIISTSIINLFLNIKNKFIKKNEVAYKELFHSHSLLIYDVGEEKKKEFRKLSKIFYNKPKISLFHGSDYKISNQKNSTTKIKVDNNLVQLLWSKDIEEKNHYTRQLTIKNFENTGCPKSDKQWIKKFKKSTFENKKKNVFLISRESNNTFFSLNKKKDYLKNIKKIIIDKLKLRLIIKLHPRENSSVGKYFYSNIFGIENYNKKWFFSNDNSYSIGKSSNFAISFYSGVSIDLLNLNVPTIEFLKLTKDDLKYHLNSTFKKNNIFQFQITYKGLALHATNIKELEKHALSILNNRKIVQDKLQNKYKKLYIQKNQIRNTKNIIRKIIKSK